MTEMTTYQQGGAVQAPSQIVSSAHEMNAAMTIANGIVGTSFVPAHFKGKAEEAAAAIMYGATLGFDPLTSLQQLYSIGGKPALYARAMVAVVMSQGHKIWTVEDKPDSVTVAGQRRGSEHVEEITWTMDRAKTAGYTSNANYKKDPHAMLYARASGDVARRIAPDALLGLAYSAEELQLGEGTTSTQQVTAAQFVKPEPAAQPDEPAAPVETGEVPSEAQTRKMFAALRDIGLTDREDILEYVGNIVGREVESSKDLTRTEVHQIIDSLEGGN